MSLKFLMIAVTGTIAISLPAQDLVQYVNTLQEPIPALS